MQNGKVIAYPEKQILVYSLNASLGKRLIKRHLHDVTDVQQAHDLHRVDLQTWLVKEQIGRQDEQHSSEQEHDRV